MIVVDGVGGDEFVCYVRIAPTEALLLDVEDQDLILFFCHGVPLLLSLPGRSFPTGCTSSAALASGDRHFKVARRAIDLNDLLTRVPPSSARGSSLHRSSGRQRPMPQRSCGRARRGAVGSTSPIHPG